MPGEIEIDDKKLSYTYNEKFPGISREYYDNDQILTFSSDNDCHLRIELLSEKIIRFRYAVRPFFPADFSYAIDPSLEKEEVVYSIVELKDMIIIETDLLNIHISKDKLLVDIYNKKKELLSSDEKGFHWEENHQYGGEVVKMSKSALAEEAFYGMGDKTSEQNLRGSRVENWGSDEFGFKAGTDPLYKNINLYYSYHKGKTYAIYFDNSFRTFYDIGKEREDIISFWADGGEMNYYFMYGTDLLDTATQYIKLTGSPEMPPLWALGYQQCKWSYYPESKVRDIAAKMRDLEIPCDAIYLDIDYMDGFRCFTWDKERFPEPKKMVADLKSQGFKTIAIIDPGIKIDMDYDVFKEGLVNGHFCRRMDGSYMQGKVWPGECYFPDFTNPEVRTWWSDLFDDLISNIGLAGIWNDMNEPAIFEVPTKTFPLDVRHDYDGHPCSHRKAHNIYGMQMARATYDGVNKFAPGKRPLIITRSGFAGMQRFCSTWTGDNIASWEHLYIAHLQTLRLSISGVSFCGSDVGGFIDQPDGELYVRWVQMAVFHPFFRTHSSGDHGDQEPWSFGAKNTAIVREAIKLRYELLPYMYTCFYQHHLKGVPMLRPLIFSTNEEEDVEINDEAFLGDHLLYCPVFEKNSRQREVYLPEGNWYDYVSNKKYKGKRTHKVKATLTKIPFYIREGAVIPNFPQMQYVGEKDVDVVRLKVYYIKGSEQSFFYADDQDGHDYKKGVCRYTRFETHGTLSSFSLGQFFNSQYTPSFEKYKLQFVGLSASILNIEVDGQQITEYHRNNGSIVEFLVDIDFEKVQINF